MVSLDEILVQVERAQSYYTELLDADTISMQNGCAPINKKKIKCLYRLITALNWDLNDNIDDQVTENIYTLLVKEISPYNGGVLPVNPDVIIPGRTVIIPPPPYAPIQLTRAATDLIDAQPNDGVWYLPFVDDNGQPISNRVPVSVTDNGVGFDFRFDETTVPARIYGFANNDAPQVIIVKAI